MYRKWSCTSRKSASAARSIPPSTVLRLCVLEATEDRKTDPEMRQRVQQMLDFMELTGHDTASSNSCRDPR